MTTIRLAAVLAAAPLFLAAAAHGRNLILNPGFEDGLDPWFADRIDEAVNVFPAGEAGVAARGGDRMFGVVGRSKDRTESGRVFQTVEGLTPGYRYRFSAWINTWGNRPLAEDDGAPWYWAKSRLFIGPRGESADHIFGLATDREDVVYSHPGLTFPHEWGAARYAASKGRWLPVELEARAQAAAMTVGIQAVQLTPFSHNFVDDVALTMVPIPAGTVTGTVLDPADNPAGGILVQLDPWGFAAETADDGGFRMDGVPENDYTIRCWLPGLGSSEGSVRVFADRTTDIAARLGCSGNLLVNPGFETREPADPRRAFAWKPYGDGFDEVPVSEGWFFGYRAPEGKRALGVAADWDLKRGGVYQAVSAHPGRRYELRCRVLTHDEDRRGRMAARIGIDPSGGTDPEASTVVWSPSWRGHETWHTLKVDAPARRDRITVFLDFAMTEMERFKVALFDDASLAAIGGEAPHTPVESRFEVVLPPGDRIINGGFESGDLAGWTRLYACPVTTYPKYPQRSLDPDFDHTHEDLIGPVGIRGWEYVYEVHRSWKGYVPPAGERMFGGIHAYDSAGSREFLCQTAVVEPGATYRLSAWAMTETEGVQEDANWVRLAADPHGGYDFPIRSGKFTGPWAERELQFTAQAGTVTIGIEMGQDLAYPWNVTFCDDIRLVRVDGEGRLEPPAPRNDRPLPASIDAGGRDACAHVLPDGETTLELVRIPAGVFVMGGRHESRHARPNELPRRRVELPEYYIGRYEVSNAQYKAFCEATGHPLPADPVFQWELHSRYTPYRYMDEHPDHPVLNVTWEDARAFCAWAGLRLPTEAEWEKAARGPHDYIYTHGDRWRTIANTMYNHLPADWFRFTSPVGFFGARPDRDDNPWGVRDMAGNVREWVFDWYGDYAPDAAPTGPASGSHKVIRGACWLTREYLTEARMGYRMAWPPRFTPARVTGFRAAADPKEPLP